MDSTRDYVCCGRASFGLEPGAAGQKSDFKETNKMLEWSLKKASVEYIKIVLCFHKLTVVFQIVGGAEHTLRAKLTFSQEFHGEWVTHPLKSFLPYLSSQIKHHW